MSRLMVCSGRPDAAPFALPHMNPGQGHGDRDMRAHQPWTGTWATGTWGQGHGTGTCGHQPRTGTCGNLNPRVAAKNKWQRIEALGRMKEFLRAYAEALVSFLEGKREVVFPAGTYWMVRYAGALAAAPG